MEEKFICSGPPELTKNVVIAVGRIVDQTPPDQDILWGGVASWIPRALLGILCVCMGYVLGLKVRLGDRQKARRQKLSDTSHGVVPNSETHGARAVTFLPSEGKELLDVPPAFLVGKWVHSFLHTKTGKMRSENATVHPDGTYTVGEEERPRFILKRFDCEWSKKVITFDKVNLKKGTVQRRECLSIREQGNYLAGKAEATAKDRRDYRRIG